MIREISEEELELQKVYMSDGAPAFSGAMYRQGWYNQVIYAIRTRDYATVWIFGNRGPQYLLWATSTDGAMDMEEVVWTKEEADEAHKGFLKALKNENPIVCRKYIRKNDDLKEVS